MIKIQKEDFNSEEEINQIKDLHENVGAVSSFTGYVKKKNNKIYTMNKRGQYWFISYYQ